MSDIFAALDVARSKVCYKCATRKAFDDFHNNAIKSDGKQTICKECVKLRDGERKPISRAYSRQWKKNNPERWKSDCPGNKRRRIKRLYGLTLEQLETQINAQHGKCPICNRKFNGRTVRAVIDHCHNAGHVRGILCSVCNVAIGLLKNEATLLRAAKYLRDNEFFEAKATTEPLT